MASRLCKVRRLALREYIVDVTIYFECSVIFNSLIWLLCNRCISGCFQLYFLWYGQQQSSLLKYNGEHNEQYNLFISTHWFVSFLGIQNVSSSNHWIHYHFVFTYSKCFLSFSNFSPFVPVSSHNRLISANSSHNSVMGQFLRPSLISP